MESGHYTEIRVSKFSYSEDGKSWNDYRFEAAPFKDREKLIPHGDFLFLHNLQTTHECIIGLRKFGYFGINISIVHSDRNYNGGNKMGYHKIHNGNLLHVVRASEDELREIFEGLKEDN